MSFDIIPFLARIARQDVPSEDVIRTAQRLNAGAGIQVFTPYPLSEALLPGVTLVDDPDSAHVILLAHRGNAVALAAEIEIRMAEGQRVALLDTKYLASGDPDLIQVLLDSTVYLGTLSAYDVNSTRLQAALLTPMRDGQAHRHYLAHSLLYNWAWQGVVKAEVKRRFGDSIAPEQQQRAGDHARARLGAFLMQIGRRGLPFQIVKIGFAGSRVDGLWFELTPML
jgi:Protein of unknown function (DUF4127)